MASYFWIKLYHEILDDPKMGIMPDRCWRRAIELFLMAGENNQNGLLPTTKEIAYRLRLTEDELIDDINFLILEGIVTERDGGYVVTNFAERQSPISSTRRSQMRRSLERKYTYYGKSNDNATETQRERNGNETETQRNVALNATETKRERNGNGLDKIRIDKIRRDKMENAVDDSLHEDNGTLIDNELEELIQSYRSVWETAQGTLIPAISSFVDMIHEFNEAGVTPEIYATAIQEQKKSKYPVTSPTSVKNWALGLVRDQSKDDKQKKRKRIYKEPDGTLVELEIE